MFQIIKKKEQRDPPIDFSKDNAWKELWNIFLN